ncbi:NUDT7 diphosphatase, partial [Ardeotis kori]|nr:NUDT7 diphosphatase [Ardeotis kori]
LGVSRRSFVFASRESIKQRARLRLREFDVGGKFSHLPLPRAAVLLPLTVRAGRLHLLLTVRSMQLRRSPGEVCFPGGKSEAIDKDEIDTALREAKEEVGLQPEKVEVICRLVPGIDKMNHLVTPVVGFIEDTFQAIPNPDEVSDVFVVPLEYFVKPLHYNTLPYKTKSGYLTMMHCFTYEDHEHNTSFRIWGLTAHFAVFLALIILGKRPTFEVDYDLDNLVSSSENNFMNLYASLYEKKKSNL